MGCIADRFVISWSPYLCKVSELCGRWFIIDILTEIWSPRPISHFHRFHHQVSAKTKALAWRAGVFPTKLLLSLKPRKIINFRACDLSVNDSRSFSTLIDYDRWMDENRCLAVMVAPLASCILYMWRYVPTIARFIYKILFALHVIGRRKCLKHIAGKMGWFLPSRFE